MGLFIAQTDGTETYDLTHAEVDVIAISLLDAGIGFDEVNTVDREGITCVPVEYTQNETGPTADRLDDLVNNVTYTSPPDIVIFAVDFSYSLSDGTPVGGNGLALPIGNAANPFTSHVCTFYDITLCDGAGIWVDAEGGGSTGMSTEVMLYHELSHCFHFVTGTTASTSAQEEVNAEIDENDMRDASGLDHRDVNSHNGGCGGGPPNCCIVASLATGSPYSSEVNRFRYFREHILRGSEVGDDFFKHFHYHYYGFSPEVCRLMGHQPSLSPLIKKYFVAPLLAGVELLIHYSAHKGKGLLDLLHQQAEREEFAEIYDQEFLDELSTYLNFVENHDYTIISRAMLKKGEDFSGVASLLGYIKEQTANDDFINWALVDVLRIWLSSALLLTTEKTDEEIDKEIHLLISEWIAHLPITAIWGEFSRLQMESELNNLEQFVFDRRGKDTFAMRLIEKYPEYSSTIMRWGQNRRTEAC